MEPSNQLFLMSSTSGLMVNTQDARDHQYSPYAFQKQVNHMPFGAQDSSSFSRDFGDAVWESNAMRAPPLFPYQGSLATSPSSRSDTFPPTPEDHDPFANFSSFGAFSDNVGRKYDATPMLFGERDLVGLPQVQGHLSDAPLFTPERNELLVRENQNALYNSPETRSNQSYAKVLYDCLLEAPNHSLSLKEIYSWVATNTTKAKEEGDHGWQNSVRHNLSMNGGFVRVVSGRGRGAKKGSQWRLSEDVLVKGYIKPTTTFRPQKHAEKKEAESSKSPSGGRVTRRRPNEAHQKAGRKGGNQTKASRHARKQQANLQSQQVLPMFDLGYNFGPSQQREDANRTVKPEDTMLSIDPKDHVLFGGPLDDPEEASFYQETFSAE